MLLPLLLLIPLLGYLIILPMSNTKENKNQINKNNKEEQKMRLKRPLRLSPKNNIYCACHCA